MSPTLKLFMDITDQLTEEDVVQALAYAYVMTGQRFGPVDVLSKRVAEHVLMLSIWKGHKECAH